MEEPKNPSGAELERQNRGWGWKSSVRCKNNQKSQREVEVDSGTGGDSSPSTADCLAGRRECRGEFRLDFREYGQSPLGTPLLPRWGRLRAEEEPAGLGDGVGPRGASFSRLCPFIPSFRRFLGV